MTGIAVKVEELGKWYRIPKVRSPSATRSHRSGRGSNPFIDWMNRLRRVDHEEIIWALKDVSLEVKRGDVIGIVGHNGAGKSTLLKILARIVDPSEGRAILNGRVGALLEVGTGFHPELTGRENIFLSGAIMGMKRAEITRKFDAIVSFADVAKFIDTPVKRYSSGMYVRLAFAVAAHLDPEILVVDEVLAVGDSAFQKKCLGKMGDFAHEGRTVLFVSHNMAAILDLCRTVYWLDHGSIQDYGQASNVIEKYLNAGRVVEEIGLEAHSGRRRGSVPLMRNVRLFRNGQPTATFETNGRFELEVECVADTGVLPQISLGFLIKDGTGFNLFATNMNQHNQLFHNSNGHYFVRAIIDRLPLAPGTYTLSFFLGNGSFDADAIENAISFEVMWDKALDLAFPPQPYWGAMFVPVRWEYTGATGAD